MQYKVVSFNGNWNVLVTDLVFLKTRYTEYGVVSNPRVRTILQGQPKFKELIGPMYDEDSNGNPMILYESNTANEILST